MSKLRPVTNFFMSALGLYLFLAVFKYVKIRMNNFEVVQKKTDLYQKKKKNGFVQAKQFIFNPSTVSKRSEAAVTISNDAFLLTVDCISP